MTVDTTRGPHDNHRVRIPPRPGARLRLLVSVSRAEDARAALRGGADIVDAKDPAAGALGPVTLDALRRIHAVVGGAVPVSAALGDPTDPRAVEAAARAFASVGVSFVKVGSAATAGTPDVDALLAAAVQGARSAPGASTAVVAVAYADGAAAGLPPPAALVEPAARSGAAGLLVDTLDKHGPGLRDLMAPAALTALAAQAHDTGLFVAFAGRLTIDDLGLVHAAGADIAGVRGAACVGGRRGRVSPDLVRALRARCAEARARPTLTADRTS